LTLEDDGTMLLRTSGTTHPMTFSRPRRPEPSYCPYHYNWTASQTSKLSWWISYCGDAAQATLPSSHHSPFQYPVMAILRVSCVLSISI